jgi:hypothetical protein
MRFGRAMLHLTGCLFPLSDGRPGIVAFSDVQPSSDEHTSSKQPERKHRVCRKGRRRNHCYRPGASAERPLQVTCPGGTRV